MAGNRRDGRAQVRRLRRLTAAAVLTVLAACRAPAPEPLVVAERIPLGFSPGETLGIFEPFGFWIGGPGQLVRIDSLGAPGTPLPLPDPATPLGVGSHAGRLLFRSGSTAYLIDGFSGSVIVERAGMDGSIAFDVRGRFVFRTAGAGTVLLYEPERLEPIRGWAAVGAPSTALALSPEGDRVIQAIGGGDDAAAPAILVRDLQTGRILHTLPLLEPVERLLVGTGGSIFATVGGERSTRGIVRLDWHRGQLEPRWRRSFADLGLDGAAGWALSRDGRHLAILAAEKDNGLLVLDGETGRAVRRSAEAPLDVAFDERDRLFLLLSGELLRVE